MRDIPLRSVRRRRVVAGAGAAGCLAAAVVLTLAPSAQADSPTRSGWWNSASAGSSALPQPTTAAGDLHVANAPSGPTAIAAVYYQLLTSGPSSATLELKITANSAVGTPAVMACPTTDTDWKGGDDQPWSAAPKYSCSRHANGIVSADSTKLTFLLDDSLAKAGALSLALVPAPGDTTPFSVDFAKPGFDSLMVTEDAGPTESTAPSGGAGGFPPPGVPPASAGGSPTGANASGGAATGPPLQLPDAGTLAARSDAGGSAPVVAGAPGSTPTTTGLPAAPAAATTVGDQRGRNLAIVLLLALAALLGRGTASPARQPQPLGRRRWVGPGGAAADATVPVVSATPVTLGGIGRFAKERTAPARPLI